MNASTLLLLAASFFPSQEPTKDDLAKKDLEKLQGEWRLVAMEQNGLKEDQIPEGSEASLFRVKGAKYSIRSNKHSWQDIGELKLDPTQKPKAMDATWLEGDQKELAKAIYEIDGDKLRVAYLREERMGGAQSVFTDERPKEFKMKPVEDKKEPHLRVLYLERVKK
jgi:uncharacterized protein (TIGR03067 family)